LRLPPDPIMPGRSEPHPIEIRVACSGAFKAAYLALLPQFEAVGGYRVATSWGASIGDAPTSIPNRLARGESLDLVILSADSLDRQTAAGRIAAGSRADLARSGIGVAVKAGTPRPDIGSADALVRVLLRAGSIGYSASASGVYLEGLFGRLGIADKLAPRLRRAHGEPVGRMVARGEVEIGFQQVSELLPVPGIDYVGPLPPELQETTVFSAGIPIGARQPDAARALMAFLRSADAAPVIRAWGMEPA
jgi:molybdate transport system substrate-binding protein